MDKWKMVAILALVAALGGYGWYSSNPGTAPPPPTPTPDQTPAPPPPEVTRLEGTKLAAWDIPQNFWTNTPKPLNLSDVKGHVTIVEFFRIGCSHCEEAAPFMQNLYEKYSPRGVKMIAIQSPGIAVPEENDWPAVKSKMVQWGVKYPVGFDQGGKFFREKVGTKIYPTIMVLDESGVIRYIKTGHTPQTAQALTTYLDTVVKPK